MLAKSCLLNRNILVKVRGIYFFTLGKNIRKGGDCLWLQNVDLKEQVNLGQRPL